jgi:hypothetical protein
MDTNKIDILKSNDVIVIQNLITQEQKYFTISKLVGDLLISYNEFMNMVDSKLQNQYTQIYVAKQPTIRFVGLSVDGVNVNNIDEVLYENLIESEKLIFDNFYNTFTN